MPKMFQAIFLRSSPSFYQKHFTDEVTSKYATILHIFGTFSYMLQPMVSGLSSKKIKTQDNKGEKISTFF